MARTKTATAKAATPKKPTTRKKRETVRKEPEHVHLLDRQLTPAAPTPPELPDPIEALRRQEAEERKIERDQESGRYSRVVLQTMVLCDIVRRENSPFIYNEVEDYDGNMKLIGHYKIQGVPRPKEHRHDTAR